MITPPRRRGLRATLALAVAAVTAAGGCRGSDPQPLELVTVDAFGDAQSLVDGGGAGSTIGYTGSAGSGLPTLRLVRHDADRPDPIEPIGDLAFPGGSTITRLRVTDEAAAVVVGDTVRVVDLTGTTLPVEQLAIPGAIDLAVRGRWVAVVVDGGLVLVDRDAPTTQHSFTASATPTALLAAGGAFLAFVPAGYVAVDVSGPVPVFEEVLDPDVRAVRAGAADGEVAVVAGKAAVGDRSRVLRLSLADPSSPVLLEAYEAPGGFVAFAWDGGETSVVAVHGAGDDVNPDSFHQGYVVRGAVGDLRGVGVPLPFWSQSRQPFAAHAGHLFAAQAGGVALLRIR